MKNIKALKMTILVVCMSFATSLSAFAAPDGPVSLDQLESQATAQETTAAPVQETQAVQTAPATSQGSQGSSTADDARSSITEIANSSKLDTSSPTAQKAGAVMQNWGSKLMQILGYVISIGLGLITALDIVYMSIPPLRGILANGYVGSADQRPDHMQGNSNPGIGMIGGGGTTGWQQDRMNMTATNNNQPATGRMQFVTNAALNAVAAASTGDNPFKVWFKQQLPVLIIAPLLFVLAATGILANIGFFIGNYITSWISSMI